MVNSKFNGKIHSPTCVAHWAELQHLLIIRSNYRISNICYWAA